MLRMYRWVGGNRASDRCFVLRVEHGSRDLRRSTAKLMSSKQVVLDLIDRASGVIDSLVNKLDLLFFFLFLPVSNVFSHFYIVRR